MDEYLVKHSEGINHFSCNGQKSSPELHKAGKYS